MGETPKKRRMTLLRELAYKSKGRHDAKLPLSEIAPSIDIKAFVGGTKFVDLVSPVYEGGSDLAYDFNTLCEEKLIELTYLDYERDSMGGVVNKDPAVTVTMIGFESVEMAGKSWIKKAIEKQPITFLQIVVTVLIFLIGGIGDWLIRGFFGSVK